MMSDFLEGGAKLYKKADEGGRQESKNTLLKFRYSEKIPKFEKKMKLINYLRKSRINHFNVSFEILFPA